LSLIFSMIWPPSLYAEITAATHAYGGEGLISKSILPLRLRHKATIWRDSQRCPRPLPPLTWPRCVWG